MEPTLLNKLDLPSDIKKLSYSELEKLAKETREVIINSVSKTGGHLASSLGAVELTIALLRMCDPLNDKIIWDVGHQSYPYKVLTGRLDKLSTLRTFGGLSGFPKITESPYDAFGTGHSSTSISAGLGIVCADELMGRKRKVISVIGDGALSGGMAFEALNNLGDSEKPMVVILNDNEMSISKNVGAISSSLSRMITGEISTAIRRDVRSILESMPVKRLRRLARKFEESMLSFFTPGILFEELGLRYIGPINGHKIKDLEKALNNAFNCNHPALIHIVTVKGKGYIHAEQDSSHFHGIAPFDITTGEPVFNGGKCSWTSKFGQKLVSMADKDSRIVAITAAMKEGTGLEKFAEKFPDRFYDTGIAEQHAMTFAAGLAIAGIKPYIAIYSTFLQRAYDQVIHDVALQNLPVRICIDRAGLVGQDGPTHHGAFDISFLRMIPNMQIFLPRDLEELELMMDLSLEWQGPVAIRYARGSAECPEGLPRSQIVPFEPELVFEGQDYAVLSAGHIFGEAYKLYEKLKEEGKSVSLINLRFLNKVNEETLLKMLEGKKAVITFEENVKTGGIGEMIQCMLADSCVKVVIMALPDDFVTHGNVNILREHVGLTADKAFEEFKKLDV